MFLVTGRILQAAKTICQNPTVRTKLHLQTAFPLQCCFISTGVKSVAANTKGKIEVKKRLGKKKSAEVLTDRKGYWNVVAFSTGEDYQIEEIAQSLRKQEMFEITTLSKELQLSDCLHGMRTENGNESQEVFIFREGALVTWNVPDIDVEALLSLVQKYQIGGYDNDIIRSEGERMSYTYGKINAHTTMADDDFVLEPHEDVRFDKFAVSNAMALSVKLGTWEATLSNYIDSMEDVTNDLKSGNKIKMSREEVMRKTGELFALRHAVNLSSDLLDTPDIYWDREDLEKVYQTTCAYFCIAKRTRVINEKINHCVELVELLSSHLQDNHHIRLEWMIIILIMVEVAFEVLHLIERTVLNSDHT